SPSFVILNEYKTNFFPVYHFDLYRLEFGGIGSIKDELSEYSKENMLTLVEWANFGLDELPLERMELKIGYIEDEKRNFEFSGSNDYYKKIIEKTAKEFYEHINN
ncbi:MAG: tRNA (adenosine(37)-N6)-threonylcarbamoyltransferase complex ATPase subunit type 1 TsaE, partial [Candidatus Gastranaerophilales bacterium]|nr:tRNA (adenosine(37)-N6)-threonylcarbamoyltransferase complex ATPase subunit type 1 TsaE [Candidatus Gastranaerophilales bacterium]